MKVHIFKYTSQNGRLGSWEAVYDSDISKNIIENRKNNGYCYMGSIDIERNENEDESSFHKRCIETYKKQYE